MRGCFALISDFEEKFRRKVFVGWFKRPISKYAVLPFLLYLVDLIAVSILFGVWFGNGPDWIVFAMIIVRLMDMVALLYYKCFWSMLSIMQVLICSAALVYTGTQAFKDEACNDGSDCSTISFIVLVFLSLYEMCVVLVVLLKHQAMHQEFVSTEFEQAIQSLGRLRERQHGMDSSVPEWSESEAAAWEDASYFLTYEPENKKIYILVPTSEVLPLFESVVIDQCEESEETSGSEVTSGSYETSGSQAGAESRSVEILEGAEEP